MTGRRASWLAVAVGGALGTLARWGVASAWPTAAGTFPVTTLVINLVGSFAIGCVLVLTLDHEPSRPIAHALLGTGVLGGFTTFSTFAVESTELIRTAHVPLALAYVLASVVGGVLCAWSAMVLVRRATGVRR